MTRWAVEGLTTRLDGFDLGPVDLALGPGSVVAVLGRTGAGKTTFLRAVGGFLPVRAGRVLRDGTDVTGTPPERRALGYVPQGLGLLPHRTVERNVSYPLEVRGRTDALAKSRALLGELGLAGLARRYPAQLSGGEAQRVALARALLAEPQLVLWDEPAAALDVDGRRHLSRVVEELSGAAHLPVVLVTHDPGLAFSVADRFLVLRRGRTVFLGPPFELLERPIDAFTARFVGYENVYGTAELVAGADAGSFAAWLGQRAGPGGIAVPRPALSGRAGGEGPWEGRVRSVRVTPEGLAVTAVLGALEVEVRGPLPAGPSVPATGDRLRFDLEEKSVRPLGAEDGPGGVA